ncbi:MAG: DUF2723 domain-containing protein, partial [Candidatus Firestonebacteria bacterium]
MKKYISIAALFFVGIVYVFTLAPCITATGDSSEMVVASYTLGVAHPPGYPLYTMIGKVFTFMPASNIAFRVNIMSVFFGLLTLFVFDRILARFIKNRVARVLGLLALAFAPQTWEYCIVAEVFTLANFLTMLIIYLLFRFDERKDLKSFLLIFFVFGLAMTHQHMTILIIPAIGLTFLMQMKHHRRFGFPDQGTFIIEGSLYVLLGFGVMLIGLLPYLYAP